MLSLSFLSSSICQGQLSLVTMYAPVFTVDECRTNFILEAFVCFYIVSWWQNPFFDACWPIAFEVLPFAKVSFRLMLCMPLISVLTNLEVTSSLRFCLFLHCFMMTKSILWWLLTQRFWSSVSCEGQLSLVSMYAPGLNGYESRSYFIFEILSRSALVLADKVHSLMVANPSLLEFFHLRRSEFGWYHLCSWFHFYRI